MFQFTEPNEVIEMVKAILHWNKYTCINFRWATPGDVNKVKIQDGPMCGSRLGMVGGTQRLYLGHNCGQVFGEFFSNTNNTYRIALTLQIYIYIYNIQMYHSFAKVGMCYIDLFQNKKN